MKISNAAYKDLRLDLGRVVLPLREGTPVGLAGTVANDENAVGLVAQKVSNAPLSPFIRVLVAGDVELAEVEAAYGEALTREARLAMSGIRFFGEDGTPVPDYIPRDEAYVLPDASPESKGGVRQAETVAEVPTGESADAEANAAAINALIAALKAGGAMAPITITTQPQDVVAPAGSDIEDPIVAVGKGLSYVWWFKDPGDTDFKVSTNTTSVYSFKMTYGKYGRQIYCVVTDESGASVKSRVATIDKE